MPRPSETERRQRAWSKGQVSSDENNVRYEHTAIHKGMTYDGTSLNKQFNTCQASGLAQDYLVWIHKKSPLIPIIAHEWDFPFLLLLGLCTFELLCNLLVPWSSVRNSVNIDFLFLFFLRLQHCLPGAEYHLLQWRILSSPSGTTWYMIITRVSLVLFCMLRTWYLLLVRHS